ncbi:hypothetical protein [Pontiella sulfatireligans]|uniref:PE-PGRS family protein n=1 Tax=Pontiella sulfatireligans TaxID=2750658 RepID=A0A6C2UMA3_9BACT|nr:hypothetical protein [Pontiella sulfatireligans]VGO21258.1 hypothetical protein SCARR_03330 [Pontiella sulfatireligans]
MKSWKIIIGGLVLVLCGSLTQAAIVVPGADGSDGALLVAENTVIDLSLATTGEWDDAGTGDGVYDSNKWAVVFKYSSVVVSNGVTVSFANHPSRAPVVWLVSGDVTIDGSVNLNGQSYQTAPVHAEPGPGGFRGGVGTYSSGAYSSPGFGVGGGQQSGTTGTAGSYGTAGGSGPSAYGNQSLLPLIGGSGGGGDDDYSGGGGAGGGALLIASMQSVSVDGSVVANGGAGRNAGYPNNDQTGGGSGGGIRIVCDTLEGAGVLEVEGGYGYLTGGLGRTRLERVVNANTIDVNAEATLSLLTLQPGATAMVWPPSNAPTAKIISIGGGAAPGDPLVSFGTHGADVVVTQTNTVQVVVETSNVETSSVVVVRSTPRFNQAYSTANATVAEVVTPDPLVVRWVADLPVGSGYGAMQVRVIRP